MGQIYDSRGADWQPIGRQGALQVASHVLLSQEEGGRTRLSITRIGPGGAFGPHIDDYGHVFCVLEGRGEAMVGKERRQVKPGEVIRTEVHEPHGLWAAQDAPLVLLTANVYPEPAAQGGPGPGGRG